MDRFNTNNDYAVAAYTSVDSDHEGNWSILILLLGSIVLHALLLVNLDHGKATSNLSEHSNTALTIQLLSAPTQKKKKASPNPQMYTDVTQSRLAPAMHNKFRQLSDDKNEYAINEDSKYFSGKSTASSNDILTPLIEAPAGSLNLKLDSEFDPWPDNAFTKLKKPIVTNTLTTIFSRKQERHELSGPEVFSVSGGVNQVVTKSAWGGYQCYEFSDVDPFDQFSQQVWRFARC